MSIRLHQVSVHLSDFFLKLRHCINLFLITIPLTLYNINCGHNIIHIPNYIVFV